MHNNTTYDSNDVSAIYNTNNKKLSIINKYN